MHFVYDSVREKGRKKTGQNQTNVTLCSLSYPYAIRSMLFVCNSYVIRM